MAMDEYKEWLLPDEEDSTKTKCRLCQRSFTLSNMGTRVLKVMHRGKSTKVWCLRVAKGTATLKDYLKKPEGTEASTLKSQPSKPQEGMHRSETVSMSKVHFDPGATQGRNSLGIEVCDVPFLLQLKPGYWRCVQSHVSRQQNCPAVVLWCNQAFIPHHIWNCTLLQGTNAC